MLGVKVKCSLLVEQWHPNMVQAYSCSIPTRMDMFTMWDYWQEVTCYTDSRYSTAGECRWKKAVRVGRQTDCSDCFSQAEIAVAELWEVVISCTCLIYLLPWINCNCSRKTCGVLIEKRVLLVLLGGRKAKRRAGPSSTVRTVINLLKEQGTNLTHLNIMRYIV